MTLTINRSATTLYSSEKADLVLYIDGDPQTIKSMWDAFKHTQWKEPFIGTDGRITLVPEKEVSE